MLCPLGAIFFNFSPFNYSTGTGRTGTLLAIDLCMQAYDDSQSVDIMNCVYRIRNDRAGAVHTTAHYAFIYKVIVKIEHVLFEALYTALVHPSLFVCFQWGDIRSRLIVIRTLDITRLFAGSCPLFCNKTINLHVGDL